jgi:signal transduction histidine kinase
MGLAITKKIIDNLGGKIWVASEEGKGSAFYFTIKK